MVDVSIIKEFVDQTTIHGIIELRDFKRVRKMLWIILMVATAVFCLWEVASLGKLYEEGAGVTEIIQQTKLSLPDISIRVYYTDMVEWRKPIRNRPNLINPYVRNYITTWCRHNVDNGGCPKSLEDHDETEETEVMDRFEGEKIMRYAESVCQRRAGRLVEKVYLLGPGDLTLAKGQLDTKAIEYRMSTYGPMAVLRLSNYTTIDVSWIYIYLENRDYIKTHRTLITAHSTSGDLDLPQQAGMSVEAGMYQFQLRMSLSRRTYTNDMCNREISKGNNTVAGQLSCVSQCRVKAALAGKTACLPFMGDVKERYDVRHCRAQDHPECLETYQTCKDYCDGCETCRKCATTVGELHTIHFEKNGNKSKMEKATGRFVPKPIIIHVDGHNIIEYHTRSQHTFVTFASQVGGMFGLCFGVSIISIAQAICLCYHAVGVSGKRGAEGEDKVVAVA